jgi:DNA-binding response OmpR family regulator
MGPERHTIFITGRLRRAGRRSTTVTAMPAKVVIVEDEPDINEALVYSLRHEGYRVWSEIDGRRGLDLVREKSPDLVLLDLMLPGVDGLDFCRQIKGDPLVKGTFIIMVTARGEESDVLVGLGLGADDYVTKPFKTRELLARVRAVLRRGRLREDETRDVIRCGELTVDSLRHEVAHAGTRVQLTATEFRLLRFLAMNPGRVFNRDQLLNQVIGDKAVVIDRNIDVHVRAIRRKLAAGRDHIETIRGVGYRFVEQP